MWAIFTVQLFTLMWIIIFCLPLLGNLDRCAEALERISRGE